MSLTGQGEACNYADWLPMQLSNGSPKIGWHVCRYTECRLQEAASASLLADLEYDTVDFLDTFDGSQQEPTVLPARLPNLLINGSQV